MILILPIEDLNLTINSYIIDEIIRIYLMRDTKFANKFYRLTLLPRDTFYMNQTASEEKVVPSDPCKATFVNPSKTRFGSFSQFHKLADQ